MHAETSKEKLLARIDYLEENRRFIQNALEMVLSLADFQEKISKRLDSAEVLKETEKRINHLILKLPQSTAFNLLYNKAWDRDADSGSDNKAKDSSKRNKSNKPEHNGCRDDHQGDFLTGNTHKHPIHAAQHIPRLLLVPHLSPDRAQRNELIHKQRNRAKGK